MQTGNIKETNIKNRTYYSFNDMINIKDFDSNLLYHIDSNRIQTGYITMKDSHYVKINSVNPSYLIINEKDDSIECNSIEESSGHKYLVFASTDKNKEVLEKYTKLWDAIKNQIKTGEYGKDYMKIKYIQMTICL